MIQVNLKVDTSNLVLRLEKGQRRLAYVVANALNRTAKDIQTEERARVAGEFTIRKPEFILRQAAIIKPFASATQGRAFVDISVGQKSRLLLSTFEEGGARPPFKGKSVAVPITGEEARPSFEQPVPQNLRFTGLRFKLSKGDRRLRRKGGRSRHEIRRGEHGTYLIPGVGVFQRSGGESHLIYSFESSIALKPRLRFLDTARRVTSARFNENLQRETISAISHAGGRGL